MDGDWLSGGDGRRWKWNWTEFCGYSGGIKPLDPDTHDLGVCFQQFCLQIPVLVLIAIISAYHCGKRNAYTSRSYHRNHVLNTRILLTTCLAILPIIRAYIILSNTTLMPLNNMSLNDNLTSLQEMKSMKRIETVLNPLDLQSSRNEVLDSPVNNGKLGFSTDEMKPTAGFHSHPFAWDNAMPMDKATSAKPIDYLVAGTEGLAWMVHLCFILGLKRGRNTNPRGPVIMRALIFLLIVISILLLRSHVKTKSSDDVLPNLSLGFSISVVTLLTLYAITLIPGQSDLRNGRSVRYMEVSRGIAYSRYISS